MTIVAVNGGGNTPQVQLERCFVKSWSTSGDADDRPTESCGFVLPTDNSFIFTDYKSTESLVVENAALEVYDWPGEYAQRFDGDGGGQIGDPVTFTFTVTPSSPSDSYAGSHLLYQDLVLPY